MLPFADSRIAQKKHMKSMVCIAYCFAEDTSALQNPKQSETHFVELPRVQNYNIGVPP